MEQIATSPVVGTFADAVKKFGDDQVCRRQAIIPDHLLGRVSCAYRLAVLGALPRGASFGGVVARSFTLTTPIWVGWLLLALVAFASLPTVNNRTIRLARELA